MILIRQPRNVVYATRWRENGHMHEFHYYSQLCILLHSVIIEHFSDTRNFTSVVKGTFVLSEVCNLNYCIVQLQHEKWMICNVGYGGTLVSSSLSAHPVMRRSESCDITSCKQFMQTCYSAKPENRQSLINYQCWGKMKVITSIH